MDDFQTLENLNYTSIEQIMSTTQRLMFTPPEVEGAIAFIKQNNSKGLETGLHPFMRDDFSGVLAEGLFGIELGEAQTAILFVKLNAGKGFFGGQKSAYSSFVGSITENEIMPGTTYKSWALGLSSVNNIYRSMGLL